MESKLPPTQKGMEAREQMLISGFCLLLEGGVDLPLDRILARLEISKGKFYHYFTGRDAFVQDCFRFCYVGAYSRAKEACPDTPQDRQSLEQRFVRLPRLVRDQLAQLLDKPDLSIHSVYLLLLDCHFHYQFLLSGYQADHAQELAMSAELLRALQRSGALRPDLDPEAAAAALCAMKDGILTRCLMIGDEGQDAYEKQLRDALNIFWATMEA